MSRTSLIYVIYFGGVTNKVNEIPDHKHMSSSPFRPEFSRMPLVFGGHENTIRDFENVFENYDLRKKPGTVHICS